MRRQTGDRSAAPPAASPRAGFLSTVDRHTRGLVDVERLASNEKPISVGRTVDVPLNATIVIIIDDDDDDALAADRPLTGVSTAERISPSHLPLDGPQWSRFNLVAQRAAFGPLIALSLPTIRESHRYQWTDRRGKEDGAAAETVGIHSELQQLTRQ